MTTAALFPPYFKVTRRGAPDPSARVARAAVRALIDEARLTPKPALVDRRGSGAHRDLDLGAMTRSARALEPTFAALSKAARGRAPSADLRANLAQIGRAGESAMMRATGGSNAHRGAIWIVGLLVAGATIGAGFTSSPSDRLPDRACDLGAQIASFPDGFVAPSMSHGERVCRLYNVRGARGEAQAGFPHVRLLGLPALAGARARGVSEDAARIDALLAIMTSLDDTCLLHRAGLPGLHAAQSGARRVLERGGSSTPGGRHALIALDRDLVARGASPGGAADLLAATLFLDRLGRAGPIGDVPSWSV